MLMLVILYERADEFVYRLRYKVHVLPCPACWGESGQPTGKITPDSLVLRSIAASIGEELPSFDCTKCDVTKKVRYEFPRLSPPKISEDKVVIGPAPNQIRKGR